MQVETIYTFKNYLYIVRPVCSKKIKARRFVQYLGLAFNKTIIPLAGALTYPKRARGIIVKYTLLTKREVKTAGSIKTQKEPENLQYPAILTELAW